MGIVFVVRATLFIGATGGSVEGDGARLHAWQARTCGRSSQASPIREALRPLTAPGHEQR